MTGFGGPWTYEDQHVGLAFYGHYYIRDEDDNEVASVHGETDEVALRNARLIARAPEMRDALERLVQSVLHENGERIQVRLAEARTVLEAITDGKTSREEK